MDVPHLFSHLSVEEHLSCFKFLVIMNGAAIKTFVYRFLGRHDICFHFSRAVDGHLFLYRDK